MLKTLPSIWLLRPYLTPGVEVDLAVGCGGAEIGNNVSELDSHFLKIKQSNNLITVQMKYRILKSQKIDI